MSGVPYFELKRFDHKTYFYNTHMSRRLALGKRSLHVNSILPSSPLHLPRQTRLRVSRVFALRSPIKSPVIPILLRFPKVQNRPAISRPDLKSQSRLHPPMAQSQTRHLFPALQAANAGDMLPRCSFPTWSCWKLLRACFSGSWPRPGFETWVGVLRL